MRTQLSPKLLSMAHSVAKVKFLKKLFMPIYSRYKTKINDNRRHYFNEFGLEVLKDFDAALYNNGIKYFTFAGTLLGAIREHGFIKYDMDIDVAMFNDDYSPDLDKVLHEAGFELMHYFEVDAGLKGRELTYVKNKVTIDIFFIYSDDKYSTYQCDFRPVPGTASFDESMKKNGRVIVRRNEFPVSRDILRIPFESIYINVPRNYDEWLKSRYGERYMIPDPDFQDKENNPNMYLWSGVNAIYKKCL